MKRPGACCYASSSPVRGINLYLKLFSLALYDVSLEEACFLLTLCCFLVLKQQPNNIARAWQPRPQQSRLTSREPSGRLHVAAVNNARRFNVRDPIRTQQRHLLPEVRQDVQRLLGSLADRKPGKAFCAGVRDRLKAAAAALLVNVTFPQTTNRKEIIHVDL